MIGVVSGQSSAGGKSRRATPDYLGLPRIGSDGSGQSVEDENEDDARWEGKAPPPLGGLER